MDLFRAINRILRDFILNCDNEWPGSANAYMRGANNRNKSVARADPLLHDRTAT